MGVSFGGRHALMITSAILAGAVAVAIAATSDVAVGIRPAPVDEREADPIAEDSPQDDEPRLEHASAAHHVELRAQVSAPAFEEEEPQLSAPEFAATDAPLPAPPIEWSEDIRPLPPSHVEFSEAPPLPWLEVDGTALEPMNEPSPPPPITPPMD